MIIRTYLPKEALRIADKLGVPEELVRHHQMVCDALIEIMSARVAIQNPNFELAMRGAAVHDMAKARYPEEISGPGIMHAELGEEILLQAGAPPELASFARGHHLWDESSPIEHVLVALADAAWKGGRAAEAETELARRAEAEHGRSWVAFSVIDDAMVLAGRPGPARLEYQASGAIPRGYIEDEGPWALVEGLRNRKDEPDVEGATNAFDTGETDSPGGRGARAGSPPRD